MNTWLIGVVVAVALLAFACGDDNGGVADGGPGPTSTPDPMSTIEEPVATPTGPEKLLQQFVDALNAGDIDGVLAIFADDAEVSGATFACIFLPCVGKDAIQRFAEGEALANVDFTIISSETSDSTVTGLLEKRADVTEAAGVDRIILSFTAEMTDGAVTSLNLVFDFDDEQTLAYARWFSLTNSVTISLGPGRDADQAGNAQVSRYTEGRTIVDLEIQSGPAGMLQPVHIHDGSCPDVGAVAFPLQDVLAGRSVTVLDVPFDDLRTGSFAINVHQSQDELGVYVACGDIPAAG